MKARLDTGTKKDVSSCAEGTGSLCEASVVTALRDSRNAGVAEGMLWDPGSHHQTRQVSRAGKGDGTGGLIPSYLPAGYCK